MNSASQSPIGTCRPTPVFNFHSLSYSTKKELRDRRFNPPPKPYVKSCPVTRLCDSSYSCVDKSAVAVSFSNNDSGFIANSEIYKPHNEDTYFNQCYDIEQKLGAGAFGEVYKVQSKEDGRTYACKKTLLRYAGEKDRQRKMEEVAKHQKLPVHSNCIEFHRAWEERQHLYILTEACEKSLAAVAEATNGNIPEKTIWNYALDSLQALKHLHKHSLVHLDVKPENIFLSGDGTCKLGDFGLMFDMSKDNIKDAMEGDPKYMSGECLESKFGPPADMFSLGISLLELALDLELPTCGQMWIALRNGELPQAAQCLSSEFQSLLKGLLESDPLKRLTAEQCLSLPAFKRLNTRRTASNALKRTVTEFKKVLLLVFVFITQCLSPLYLSEVVSRVMSMAGQTTTHSAMVCTPSRPNSSFNSSSCSTPPQTAFVSLGQEDSPTVLRFRNRNTSVTPPTPKPQFLTNGPLTYSEENLSSERITQRPLPLIRNISVTHSTPRNESTFDLSDDEYSIDSMRKETARTRTPMSRRRSLNDSYEESPLVRRLPSTPLSYTPSINGTSQIPSDETSLTNGVHSISIANDSASFRSIHNFSKEASNTPQLDVSNRYNTRYQALNIHKKNQSFNFVPPTPHSSRRQAKVTSESVQRKRLFEKHFQDSSRVEVAKVNRTESPAKKLLDMFDCEVNSEER